MEIVKFETENWRDVPEEDNPILDYADNDRSKGRRKECLLICRELRYGRMSPIENEFVVYHVPKRGEIKKLGLFWGIDLAETFAESLAKSGFIQDRLAQLIFNSE